MKKVVLLIVCLFMICACNKNKEKVQEEEVIKPIEGSIQYVTFRENKISIYDDFNSYISQFKIEGCKFISRDSNNTALLSMETYGTEEDTIKDVSGGSEFQITCPYEKTYTNTSFSGKFAKKDDKPYKDKKIIEWHIVSTNEELSLYIDETTSIIIGGNNTETIKSLKEKLGTPTIEHKELRGYVDKLIYEKGDFVYEYGVLDPISKNSSGKIYSLYITKKTN